MTVRLRPRRRRCGARRERHPLHSATINVVMLYGPRDDDELAVAKTVVDASYRYATGRTHVTATDR